MIQKTEAAKKVSPTFEKLCSVYVYESVRA